MDIVQLQGITSSTAPKKRGRANTTTAPPNSIDQTPGAGPSNQANSADPSNETPADTRSALRKKSRTSTWGQPSPLTQDAPEERTTRSDAEKGIKNSKRVQPDESDSRTESAAPTKRMRPNPRSSVSQTDAAEPGPSRAGPAPSTAANDRDEDVVITGAEPAQEQDNEPMTAEERQELTSAWEKSVIDMRNRTIVVPVHDEKLALELARALIGSAYDPNARGNPRGLNDDHVGLLFDILRRPNAKKDHGSPIFLAVLRDAIDDAQLQLMEEADARDLLSKLPPLVLKRKHAAKEAQIENALWTQTEGGIWLTVIDLDERQTELDALRDDPERPKATLLNGNHRTRAMLHGNVEIIAKRDHIRTLLEKNSSNKGDVEREVQELNQLVEGHTWRCLVYDQDKLSETARNYLVHNTHERPAMGMAVGEKVWWLGTKFETEINEERASGSTQLVTRAQAANIVQKRWRKELGVKMTATGTEADPVDPKHASHSKHLGDLAGTDAGSRLFYDPVSMEMVLDCRPALWAFGEIVDKPLAIEMLRPNGGPLIAHTWLCLRTLITLANVSGGERLVEAENWIRANDKTVPAGNDGAVELFQALHVRPERVPQLLSKYGKDQAALFGSMYNAAVEPLTIGGRVDYTSSKVLTVVRSVFDRFARTYLAGKEISPQTRLLATSIQLYARLPTFVSGRTTESFYPMATLPSVSIRDNIVQRWTGGWAPSLAGESLLILEELLDVAQMIWTVGALPSKRTCNSENWHYRSRALHQIVLRFFKCKSIGPIEARLSEALSIFEDPRLPMAFRAVEEAFSKNDSLEELVAEFCAYKTANFGYDGVKRILETGEFDYGDYRSVADQLLKARFAVKASAWDGVDERAGREPKRRKTEPQTPEQIQSEHPVLVLVHEKFWDHAWPDWFVGWDDQPSKRMGSAGMGIGWALLHRHIVDNVLPDVMEAPHTRWLLNVAWRVLTLTGERAWWRDTYDMKNLPKIPVTLPAYLHLKPREVASQRKKGKRKEGAGDEKAQPSNEPNNPAQAGTRATRASAAKTKGRGNGKRGGASGSGGNGRGKGGGRSKGTRSWPIIDDGDDEDGEEDGEGDEEDGKESEEDAKRGEKGAPSKNSRDKAAPAAEKEDELDPEDTTGGDDSTVVPDEASGGENFVLPELKPPQLTVPVPQSRQASEAAGAQAAESGAGAQRSTSASGTGFVDGIDDFDLPFVGRERLEHDGVGFPPPPAGYRYFHEAAIAVPPRHIHAPQIVSTDLPHNAWRQLAASRDALEERKANNRTLSAMDDRLSRALRMDSDTLERVLHGFAEERGVLRQALMRMLTFVKEVELKIDFACTMLSDNEAGLKVRNLNVIFLLQPTVG
ncbi:hypothetical protein FRC12_005529 [Ceratobasidium sp. 428]|nr:hypothetical protein FRC12_005529 [Ceratobasidium sp. 428]